MKGNVDPRLSSSCGSTLDLLLQSVFHALRIEHYESWVSSQKIKLRLILAVLLASLLA
jgi:hypothetical protein